MEHKTLFIIIAFALVVSACTYFILQAKQTEYFITQGQSSEIIKQKVDDLTSTMNDNLELYRQKEVFFKNEIVARTMELIKVQQKNELLEKRIRTLIAKSSSQTDTSEKLATCEELKIQVLDYIEAAKDRDSACQQVIVSTSSLLVAKDSIIQTLTTGYDSLKVFTSKSLNQQEVLESELAKAQKKVRRKTTVNRILAGAALVLSGAITTIFIK